VQLLDNTAKGMKTAKFRRHHGVKESTIHLIKINLDKIRGSIKDKSHEVQKLVILCQVALFDLTNKGETRELEHNKQSTRKQNPHSNLAYSHTQATRHDHPDIVHTGIAT
jgi:hypothetical protein